MFQFHIADCVTTVEIKDVKIMHLLEISTQKIVNHSNDSNG